MAGKLWALAVGLTALGVVSGAVGAVTAGAASHAQREVLSAAVVPTHYDLTLTPDAEASSLEVTPDMSI